MPPKWTSSPSSSTNILQKTAGDLTSNDMLVATACGMVAVYSSAKLTPNAERNLSWPTGSGDSFLESKATLGNEILEHLKDIFVDLGVKQGVFDDLSECQQIGARLVQEYMLCQAKKDAANKLAKRSKTWDAALDELDMANDTGVSLQDIIAGQAKDMSAINVLRNELQEHSAILDSVTKLHDSLAEGRDTKGRTTDNAWTGHEAATTWQSLARASIVDDLPDANVVSTYKYVGESGKAGGGSRSDACLEPLAANRYHGWNDQDPNTENGVENRGRKAIRTPLGQGIRGHHDCENDNGTYQDMHTWEDAYTRRELSTPCNQHRQLSGWKDEHGAQTLWNAGNSVLPPRRKTPPSPSPLFTFPTNHGQQQKDAVTKICPCRHSGDEDSRRILVDLPSGDSSPSEVLAAFEKCGTIISFSHSGWTFVVLFTKHENAAKAAQGCEDGHVGIGGVALVATHRPWWGCVCDWRSWWDKKIHTNNDIVTAAACNGQITEADCEAQAQKRDEMTSAFRNADTTRKGVCEYISHFQQQALVRAEAQFQRLDKQLSETDRHRATREYDPVLAENRMMIVEQRAAAQWYITNLKRAFGDKMDQPIQHSRTDPVGFVARDIPYRQPTVPPFDMKLQAATSFLPRSAPVIDPSPSPFNDSTSPDVTLPHQSPNNITRTCGLETKQGLSARHSRTPSNGEACHANDDLPSLFMWRMPASQLFRAVHTHADQVVRASTNSTLAKPAVATPEVRQAPERQPLSAFVTPGCEIADQPDNLRPGEHDCLPKYGFWQSNNAAVKEETKPLTDIQPSKVENIMSTASDKDELLPDVSDTESVFAVPTLARHRTAYSLPQHKAALKRKPAFAQLSPAQRQDQARVETKEGAGGVEWRLQQGSPRPERQLLVSHPTDGWYDKGRQ